MESVDQPKPESGEQPSINYERMRTEAKTSELPDSGQLEKQPQPLEDTANYPGNWMNLQKERMDGADFRTKFARFKLTGIDDQTPDAEGMLAAKPLQPSTAREQVAGYDAALENVYDYVGYTEAASANKQPSNAGTSNGFGEPGTVFRDAAMGEQALTWRQKDIIAAHEADHAMVEAGAQSSQVRECFDWEALNQLVDERAEAGDPIKRPSYLRKPEELLARMSQLKNYFGMQADEPFTANHLAYAREHYIADTGLNNNMTEFFTMVTPKSEQVFLDGMNKLPV